MSDETPKEEAAPKPQMDIGQVQLLAAKIANVRELSAVLAGLRQYSQFNHLTDICMEALQALLTDLEAEAKTPQTSGGVDIHF